MRQVKIERPVRVGPGRRTVGVYRVPEQLSEADANQLVSAQAATWLPDVPEPRVAKALEAPTAARATAKPARKARHAHPQAAARDLAGRTAAARRLKADRQEKRAAQ